MVKHVDRIKAMAALDGPTRRFVALNKCCQDIELVALLAALRGAPICLDLFECCTVILVGADRSDVHGEPTQCTRTARDLWYQLAKACTLVMRKYVSLSFMRDDEYH